MPTSSDLGNALRWLRYFGFTLWRFVAIPWLRSVLGAGWEARWSDVRAWAVGSHRIFGIRIDWLNPDQVDLGGQVILVANHRSWFDQLAIVEAYPRPAHFLAHRKYCDLPLFGYGLHRLGESIPVENKRLSPTSQADLERYLERGDSMLFFVEGTRGAGKTLLPFNPGAFRHAARHGIPILPLYIFGSEQILSKERSMLAINPGTITLLVGAPRAFHEEGLDQQIAEFEADYRARHDEAYERFTPSGVKSGAALPPERTPH